MPRLFANTLTALAFLCASFVRLPDAEAQSTAPPPAEPSLELAPEHTAPQTPAPSPTPGSSNEGSKTGPDSILVRGLAEQRLERAAASESGTSIGGYGEIQVRGLKQGKNGEREWVADITRLVLMVSHSFNNSFRFYSEFEVEHTLACATCPGAFEVEQAIIDWRLLGDALSARAGLILVPMGIINQWHEPPIFHGVVRPRVDTVVIPSTWREIGAGIFGKPVESVRYEAYALTGLNPMRFSADGLSAARQGGAFAAANAWALAARLEWEPLLGAVLGASGYYSDAGGNGEFFNTKKQKLELSVPVIGWDVDLRYRRSGLEWRIVYTEWNLPDSDALMVASDATGKLIFDPTRPVPTRMRGAYVEGAYDVFRPLGISHQLLPFARLEYYNTQSAVPTGYQANPTFSVREYTFGLSYRPIRQIVLKADYQLRNRRLGLDDTQLNFGLGFMY